MIVHEIIDFHAERLFPVWHQDVNPKIEDAFAMRLRQNHEFICLELDPAVSKAF